MFFGLCAIGYQAGVVGYAIGVGYALGLLLLARFLPRIRQLMIANNCDTMDDLVGATFGRWAQLSVTIVNVFFFLAILAAQFIALASFLLVFTDIQSTLAFIIAVGVVLLYTALAGFKGVLLTDVYQFSLLSVGALLIFGTLVLSTPRSSLAALPNGLFTGLGFGPGFLVGVLLLFPLSLLARTDLWQRIVAAENPEGARRAFIWAAPILLIFYLLLTTVGLLGRASLGDEAVPETAGFVRFLEVLGSAGNRTLLDELSVSMLALAVFSALLSTADTNLNVVSVALAKAWKRHSWAEFEAATANKTSGPKTKLEVQLLRHVQIVTLLLGVAAVLVARVLPDIVDLIVAAGSSVMLFLPVIISTLRGSKKKRGSEALASVVVGFAVLVVLLPLPGASKIAFLPATVSSFITYGLVSAWNTRKSR